MMKQGFNPLPSVQGYGNTTLPQAFVNPNAQKPIRPFFKVPSEGVYRMAEELIFNPPKVQRKTFQPLAGTKISFVSAGDGKTDGKETKTQESTGIYFVMNIAESIPLYYLKDIRTAQAKEKTQPLSFREMPTCHAFNKVTASPSKLELLIGFSSADLLIYEPLSKTSMVQFNKDRGLAAGKVTSVAWVPGGQNEFVVSFASGCLLFMDRYREDQPASSPTASKEPSDSFCVIRQKNPKYNPVSKWCISSKAINGFAFSPSGKSIAVASQDGHLRVFDCEEETMQVAFRSYYGGFTCVAWSPDGKYLVTGGEDDLVCVWSPLERCLLARGQGHRSWVTEVRFDPWGCGVGPNNSTYRIASVGEDTRLLLWDFERETLRRPRNMSLSFSSHRIVGDFKMNLLQVQSQALAQTQPTQPTQQHTSPHPAEQYKAPIVDSRGRNEVPQIQSLVEHRTHHEPVSDVAFMEHFLVTCSWGKVKFWARPSLPSPVNSPSPLPDPSLPSTLPSTSSSLLRSTPTPSTSSHSTVSSATVPLATPAAVPSTSPP